MGMIKFKQDTELAIVTKFDEDSGDTLEESNETFREGVEIDAEVICYDDDGYVDIEFGDGSIAFTVEGDSIEVIS